METSYPTKLVSNGDQTVNLLLLRINVYYGSQFSEILPGILKCHFKLSTYSNVFSIRSQHWL